MPVSGPGWNAKQVFFGVEYSSDANQFFSSAGFGGLTFPDAKSLAEAVIADVNKRGGILGRKVVGVYRNTSTAASQSDPSSAGQATCVAFSEDNHVFAAVVKSESRDCLAQHRIAVAPAGSQSVYDRTYLKAREPYLYVPSAFDMEKLSPLLLDRLTAQGYFPKGAKVGIFYAEQDPDKRDAEELKKLLEARGIKVAATYGYNASSAQSVSSSAPQAVLPFRSAGVDHVLGLDANVGLFMIAAEQQNYRPRYGISTYLNPRQPHGTAPRGPNFSCRSSRPCPSSRTTLRWQKPTAGSSRTSTGSVVSGVLT